MPPPLCKGRPGGVDPGVEPTPLPPLTPPYRGGGPERHGRTPRLRKISQVRRGAIRFAERCRKILPPLCKGRPGGVDPGVEPTPLPRLAPPYRGGGPERHGRTPRLRKISQVRRGAIRFAERCRKILPPLCKGRPGGGDPGVEPTPLPRLAPPYRGGGPERRGRLRRF